MTLRPSREEALLALAGLAWVVGWLVQQPVAAGLVGGLAATGLLVSRRRPAVAAGLVLGGCLVAGVLGVPAESPATLFPVAVAVYGLGRWCGWLAATIGVVAFVAAVGWADGLALPTMVFAAFLYSCFWGFGRLVAAKTARAVEARQRAVRVGEQDPAAVAAAVVAEERTRLAADIARVVGEAVSAMVADAEVAARSLDEEVIDRVRRRGTAAVTELRRMLGLIRSELDRDTGARYQSSSAQSSSAQSSSARWSWRGNRPTAALQAGAVGLLNGVGLVMADPRPRVAVLVLLGLLPLVLVLRTNRLVLALLVTAASIGLVGLDAADSVQPAPMGVGVVLVLMLMSWSAGVDGRRAVWWSWLVMAGISAVVVLFGDPDNAALQVLLTVLPAWAGHAGSEGDREQRAAQASTDQAQSDIDRAVAAAVRRERLRVARDLHDVTSHALGVMVLHAGAAAAQCRTDPARARLSLQIVQDTGRGALGDLGRLVGLIDAGALGVTGADAAVLAGEPADLPDRLAALAQRIRHTGAEVRLRVPSWSGSEPSPDGELGQVCFRIVQEALTNVVRHAPGSRVAVVLDRSGEGWRLEVTDDGARPRNASGTGGSGFGLVGAAERVLALGGEFRAGPAPTGGWAVRAWIPAAAAVPAEVVTPEGLP